MTLAILSAGCVLLGCADESPPGPTREPDFLLDQNPTWASTSDSIAFVRVLASSYGPAGVYIISSSGGAPRLVTTTLVLEPSMSPDGRTLAAIGGQGLVLIDIATGEVRQVLYTDNLPALPSWSPDGTRIVYTRLGKYYDEPADSGGLHIVDLTTGDDHAITHNGAVVSGDYPSWSPADSVIAFAPQGGIATVSPDGQSLRTLLTEPSGSDYTNPLWLTGSRLLVEVREGGRRSFIYDPATGGSTSLGYWAGPYRALAPQDTAVVVTGRDPQDATSPMLLLFVRRLDDIAGAGVRQLTSYVESSSLAGSQ